MTRLRLELLTKTYARRTAAAVHDLSLTVASGELLVLLGPSGSGKSTILKLITGIEHADRGDIHFDGTSVLGLPTNRRGAVLMFQQAYLFPFLSVGENVAFGLKMAGASGATRRAEVARMLDLVELPGIERRKPRELSGGEQQRVALARALVTRPRVLLLDEPLSSLDTTVRENLQGAIRRIQRDLALTTILVTHDLGEAITLADRIGVLRQGHLVGCDEPMRLFERPATEATARFVGVSTFLAGPLTGGNLVTELGVFAVAGAYANRPVATYGIRPERVRLLSAPALNAVEGVIQALSYKGEFTEVRVMAMGRALLIRHYGGLGNYQCGEAVWVQFPPEALFPVLPD